MEAILFKQTTAKTLQALIDAPAVSLREVAYRSNLQLRSVQLALEELLEFALVEKEDTGYRSYFSLNLEHPQAKPLISYFRTLKEIELNQLAEERSERAKRVLTATDDLFEFATTTLKVAREATKAA